MEEVLTERQQREREFYEKFSRQGGVSDVSFEPVECKKRRPWNSYWYTYDLALQRYERGDRKLLDFGCGTGDAAIRLARLGYEVWAFDISEANIAIAKQRAQRHDAEAAIHFSVQAAERLDYQAEQFDIVVGFNILHHVDVDPAVQEVMRVLRPGGIAFFREHIEAPLFDTVRNSWWMRSLSPKGKSYDRHKHITEDERKLNKNDLKTIARNCTDLDVRRFSFLSRLKHFTYRGGSKGPSYLEMADHGIFAVLPFLRGFGGDVILTLSK